MQLKKLAAGNERRKELSARYRQRLVEVKDLHMPFACIDKVAPVYHIFPVLLSVGIDRQNLISKLREDGIQTSIHYPSFREFTAYSDADFPPTPVSDVIARHVLTLPLFPTMSDEQQDLVVERLLYHLVH